MSNASVVVGGVQQVEQDARADFEFAFRSLEGAQEVIERTRDKATGEVCQTLRVAGEAIDEAWAALIVALGVLDCPHRGGCPSAGSSDCELCT